MEPYGGAVVKKRQPYEKVISLRVPGIRWVVWRVL
jgi:hypothetical protein